MFTRQDYKGLLELSERRCRASDRAVEKEELTSKDKLESFIMKENYLVQYVIIHPQLCFRICLWEFPALMLNNSVTSFQVNVMLLSAFVRRQSYACEAGPFSSNQKGWEQW